MTTISACTPHVLETKYKISYHIDKYHIQIISGKQLLLHGGGPFYKKTNTDQE